MGGADWMYGVAEPLIKQECSGDNDGVTLNLGSAVSGFRAIEGLGDGHTYYWLTKGTDWELGYAYLDSTAHTLTRHANLLVMSSTSSLLSMAGSDSGVISQPPNPLAFGRRGAQVAPSAWFSVPSGSMERVELSLSDALWSSDSGIIGTNEFVLPGWVQAVRPHIRGDWEPGIGARRAVQAVIGTSAGSGNINVQVEQPGMTGGGSFAVDFGIIERYNDGTSTDTRLWFEAFQDSGDVLSLANYVVTVEFLP